MKKLIIVVFVLLSQLNFAITTPTGNTEQYFCSSDNNMLDAIIVNTTTGTVFWFDSNDNTSTPLPITTPLIGGTTYYAFESLNTDETSLAVTIHLLTEIPAPIYNGDFFGCDSGFTLNDLSVINTDDFTTIYWFADADQLNLLSNNTPIINGATYYAFQGIGSCAQPTAVSIELDEPIPAPIGETEQTFCEGENSLLEDLEIFNTSGYQSFFYFSDITQITPLPNDTLLENGITYYVFQGIGSCAEPLTVTTQIINDENCTVNVSEQLLNSFTVFPNPTKNNLTIKTANALLDTEIIISDFRGRIVLKKSVLITNTALNIDVSNLENNIYFITLINQQNKSTQKFVKK